MQTHPISQQILCLQHLRRMQSIDAAAEACGLDRESFEAILISAERMYGRPLVEIQDTFKLTEMGEIVLRCSAVVLGSTPGHSQRLHAAEGETGLTDLLNRRSVSPKRLGEPGPNRAQIDLMLQAALAAPDHGSLHPWRTLEFGDDQRQALAGLFEQEKLRRDPLAPPSDVKRAREHATRPPSLLAFVVSPRARSNVPEREQWLAAGAALCNLLNAAHQLGFGAIILSGERCHDKELMRELGLGDREVLAGFISMGQIVQVPPRRKPTAPSDVWSSWSAHPPRSTSQEAPMAGRRLEN